MVVRLEINNPTLEPIEILSAELSCGCMEVEPGPRSIPAKDTTFMVLKVAVPVTAGAFRQSVSLKLKSLGDSETEFGHVVQLVYRSTPNFQLVPQAQRWPINADDPANSTFVLELRANHGFDAGTVKVTADTESIEILHSIRLDLQGVGSSRRMVIARILDRDPNKIPKVIRFSAKRPSEEKILASSRIVIFQEKEIEILPNFVSVLPNAPATIYAKFATPPISRPVISIVSENAEELRFNQRTISSTLIEMKVEIPISDDVMQTNAIVKITSASGFREFTVPIRVRRPVVNKTGE